MTAVYLLRLFERIFVLPPEEELVAQTTEPEPRIVATVSVLAAAVLTVGFANALIVRQVLMPVAERLVG